VPEAGWILAQSHPGGENLERLQSKGILLGPDVDSCTVPGLVVRHAPYALVVQVHAYGAEVEAKGKSESRAAASSIRIAPRSTSSLFLQEMGQQTVSVLMQ